jgi:K+-transporting ATPase KdpF subunit
LAPGTSSAALRLAKTFMTSLGAHSYTRNQKRVALGFVWLICFTFWLRCCSLLCVGLSPKRVIACRVRHQPEFIPMDYIIGGVASVFLFAYLIYALLKPEKF